jgi:hypothetical protein
MNANEMSELVRTLIGDLDGAQFTATQVLAYLNSGQRFVALRLECCESSATGVALDANGGIALPVGFIRPRMLLWNGEPLAYRQHSEYLNPSDTSTGEPDFYYQINQGGPRRLQFHPAQTALKAVNYTLYYTSVPADMALDLAECVLPEHVHEIICMYAVAKCKMQENDYEGYRFIMAEEVHTRLNDAVFELSPIPADSYGVIRDVIGSSEVSSYLNY